MKRNFIVQNPEKYDGTFSGCGLPVEIGHFSLNSDGKFCDDDHQLKYLVKRNEKGLHLDLEEGYFKYIYPSKDSEYSYNILLRWIVAHPDAIKKHFVDRFNLRMNIDFVCFRGIMRKICSTVYQESQGWSIIVGKYKSTIYLSDIQSVYLDKQEKLTDESRRACTWGYKFEQYMTSARMNSRPDTSVPVNENEKFYTVMKSQFGNHTLLLTGELDAVDPAHFDVPGSDPTSVLRYVELKTSRRIECKRQHFNFLRYKLLDWYLQSFLVGTQRVVCGIRDDDRVVRNLEILNVNDMPVMANGMWSPEACLNFGIRFLNFVKDTVVKDCTEAEYTFSREPGSDIICREIPASENGFPPKWYTESKFSIT